MAEFTGTGGATDWELVEIKTAGGGVTTLDFDTVLAGNTDKQYRMDYYVKNGNAGVNISLRLNGAAAAGSQQYNQYVAAGTSFSRPATCNLGGIANNDYLIGTLFIPFAQANLGARVAIAHTAISITTALGNVDTFTSITTPALANEITGMGIATSTANMILAGSTIILWRQK